MNLINVFDSTWSSLRYTIQLLWKSSRRNTVLLGLLAIIEGPLLSLQLWLVKLLVDNVLQNPQQSISQQTIFLLIGSLLTIVIFQNVISQLSMYLFQQFGNLLTEQINNSVLSKANELELEFFENPNFHDNLRRAQEEASTRPLMILIQIITFIRSVIALSSLIIVLFGFGPLVLFGLLIGAVVTLFSQSQTATLEFNVLDLQIPAMRKLVYLGIILTSDTLAKELKIFGLGEYFKNSYINLLKENNTERLGIAQKQATRGIILGVISAFIYGATLVLVIMSVLDGSRTIGDLTLFMGAFVQAQLQIALIIGAWATIYQSGLFLTNLERFLSLESKMKLPVNPRVIQRPLKEGFYLENVDFTYPNEEKPVLQNLTFSLKPGELVAIVGTNGAGKTSLIKLLTRLYDATGGKIYFEGHDLREYDQKQLRNEFSVIFQDYLEYQGTVRENIGFGDLSRMNDQNIIEEAARKTGADRVAQSLPYGYDTVLGKWFDEGRQISTGQWQMIALARALLRTSSILILDEPTASLDAVAEEYFFRAVREQLASDQIGIIVSHRFSTVRHANQIIVLEDGKLVETGTHEELISTKGLYARLYELQTSHNTLT